MNKKKSAVALASTLLLVGVLAACTKSTQNVGNGSSADAGKPAATAGNANSGGGNGTATATSPTVGPGTLHGIAPTGSPTAGSATAGSGTSASVEAGKAVAASKNDATAGGDGFTSELPPHLNVNLNDLPDNMVICQVSGTPITIGDYRRRMKIQQAQAQKQVTSSPALQANLLQLAKQNNVQLTADEKTKLIETAKAQHGANFAEFLKQNNVTEADFDRQVENAGLVFKMANAQLQETLLPQLIKQEILVKAAMTAGHKKDAEANYEKFKHTDSYKSMKSMTQLSDESLHTELVKGELASMQVEKLGRTARVSDSDIRNWYNHNKSKVQHNDRIRLSSILIVAPAKDVGPIKSVRTQLKAANPKWTDADLDSKTAAFMTQAQNQALILLGLGKAPGSDFAKLANEHNQGPKNGGDMGWQEKRQLAPDFVAAVWNLKPGTVLPSVVKTTEGFRIIKVTGKEPKGPLPLLEVHQLIAQKLQAEKTEQAVNTWVAAQQGGAKIEFSKRFLAASGVKNKTN